MTTGQHYQAHWRAHVLLNARDKTPTGACGAAHIPYTGAVTSHDTGRMAPLALTLTAALALSACGGGERTSSEAGATTSAAAETTADTSSWTGDVGVARDPAPVLSGTTIVASGADSSDGLVGIDALTGVQRWSFLPELPTSSPTGTGSGGGGGAAAGVGGGAPAGGGGDESATTGALSWTTGVAHGQPVAVVTRAGHIPASGLDAAHDVTVVAAVSLDSGKQLWTALTDAGHLVVPDEGDLDGNGLSDATTVVFSAAGDSNGDPSPGALTALDLATGEPAWQSDQRYAVFALAADTVVGTNTTATGTRMVGIDAATGDTKWEQALVPESAGGPGGADTLDRQEVRLMDTAGGALLVLRVDDANGYPYPLQAFITDAATGQVRAQTTGEDGLYRPLGWLAPDARTAFLFEDEIRSITAFGVAQWTVQLPKLTGPGDTGQDLLGLDPDGNPVIRSAGIVVLDAATGKQVGDVQPDATVGNPYDDSTGDRVLFTVQDRAITWDAEDGTLYADPATD